MSCGSDDATFQPEWRAHGSSGSRFQATLFPICVHLRSFAVKNLCRLIDLPKGIGVETFPPSERGGSGHLAVPGVRLFGEILVEVVDHGVAGDAAEPFQRLFA